MTRPTPSVSERTPSEDPDAVAEFEVLLAYLKLSRGFDFTAYKRTSLMRRVQVRMQALGMSRFAAYLDFLQVDPEEFTRSTCATRSCRSSSAGRARRLRSASGARAAPRARRPIRSPFFSRRQWGPTHSASG